MVLKSDTFESKRTVTKRSRRKRMALKDSMMKSVIRRASLVCSFYLLVNCYLITIRVITTISPTKKMDRMTFHFLLYFCIRS